MADETKLVDLGKSMIDAGQKVAEAEAAQDAETVPLTSGLMRLTRSSIALVVGLAVIGTIIMNVLGKIDGPTAINAVLVLVGLLAGKTALEDSAEKIGANVQELRSKGIGQAAVEVSKMLPAIVDALGAPRPDPKIAEHETKLRQLRELAELNERLGGGNVVPIKPPPASS